MPGQPGHEPNGGNWLGTSPMVPNAPLDPRGSSGILYWTVRNAARTEARPCLSELPTLLEQIAAPVGGFDPISDRMGQRCVPALCLELRKRWFPTRFPTRFPTTRWVSAGRTGGTFATKWLIPVTGWNGGPQAGIAGNALQNRCTATVLTRLNCLDH